MSMSIFSRRRNELLSSSFCSFWMLKRSGCFLAKAEARRCKIRRYKNAIGLQRFGNNSSSNPRSERQYDEIRQELWTRSQSKRSAAWKLLILLTEVSIQAFCGQSFRVCCCSCCITPLVFPDRRGNSYTYGFLRCRKKWVGAGIGRNRRHKNERATDPLRASNKISSLRQLHPLRVWCSGV